MFSKFQDSKHHHRHDHEESEHVGLLHEELEEVHFFDGGTKNHSGGVEINLIVEGMTCTGCSNRLTNGIASLPGIFSCEARFLSSSLNARHDPSLITQEQIIARVAELGFSARLDTAASSTALSELDLVFSGPSALSPSALQSLLLADPELSRMISSLSSLSARDPSTMRLMLALSPGADSRTAFDRVHALVSPRGLDVALRPPEGDAMSADEAQWNRRLLLSVCLAVPVALLTFVPLPATFTHALWLNIPLKTWLQLLFAAPIQFYVALPLYASAYRTLRYSREVEMDFLITFSTSVAFLYSIVLMVLSASGVLAMPPWEADYFFDTTAVLITLIVLGRWMEKQAKRSTTTILGSLRHLQVSTALLAEDPSASFSQPREIDVRLCRAGDLLRVLPGAKVPLDGTVVAGVSEVDESMLSGEPMPVPKGPGAAVYGGTINQTSGSLLVRVLHASGEGTLAQLHKLIETTQSTKPSLQRYVDLFASKFIYVIILLSITCFVVWYTLASTGVVATSSPFAFALRFAITVMVISCPCALALASPTAVMVASGVAAQNGVVFKSGSALETASQLTSILFDKTGTLTTGCMSVESFCTPATSAAFFPPDLQGIPLTFLDRISPPDEDHCGPSDGCGTSHNSCGSSAPKDPCSTTQSQNPSQGGCCGSTPQSSTHQHSLPVEEKKTGCCAAKPQNELPPIDQPFSLSTQSGCGGSTSKEPFLFPASPCSAGSIDMQSPFQPEDDCCGSDSSPHFSASDSLAVTQIVDSLPSVTTVPLALQHDPELLVLSLVSAIESQSQHPIAKAILQYADHRFQSSEFQRPLEIPLTQFITHPGLGVSGRFTIVHQGEAQELCVSIGSAAFMDANGVRMDWTSFMPRFGPHVVDQHLSEGKVIFYVGIASRLAGVFILSDPLKPESAAVVQYLQTIPRPLRLGIVSGDSLKTVEAIASNLTPVNPLIIHAGLTPEQKALIVQDLQESGERVGLVGDGINDSVALSQAHLGFALSDGTDLAISAADVILLKSNLEDIVLAIDLSAFTMRIIKINIGWGILYNILTIPLAVGLFWPFGVSIPPALAGFAEFFSSIPVILFSLLIRRFQPQTLTIN